MLFRALSRSLLAVLFATSGKAQFEIRGSRLYLDRDVFPVRGVAYGPTPVGATPGTKLDVSGCLYGRDLPLMARAGINTVRVYGRIASTDTAFWQGLDRNNLYLLAGFPLDPYHDPRASLAPGSGLRARILRDLGDYAAELSSRRRVVALVVGNEVSRDYTRKFGGAPRDFYSLVEEAAAALRPMLVTTAVAEAADIGLIARDADLPHLAFWSVNVFRGLAFDTLFDDLARRTAKPVLVSEFGVDAFDSVRLVEDGEPQANALRNLVRLLRQAPVLGSVWFEWSDEWWRGGADPARHGQSGDLRAGFPDGVANWGWFGLFGLITTESPGLDSLRARPALAALAEEWGVRPPEPPPRPPRLTPRGVVNAGSLAPTVAPGSLVSLFGEDLAAAPASFTEDPLPLQSDLTSVCFGVRPAPLLSAGPGQINAQVPWETPLGAAAVLVYRAGAASNRVNAEVREIAPGILDRGVLQAGKPCPVSVTSGVRPGAYLEVYGTGLGSISRLPPSGSASALPSLTDVLPRAYLGSRELRVLYSGLLPGVVGLYQTNTQVPEDFPPTAPVGLRLFSGGIESNAYRLTVLADADRPRFGFTPANLDFVIQPGGPPQAVTMAIDGYSGFCDLVRFTSTGLPEGLTVSAPVGFPGQLVPVAVQASLAVRGNQDVAAAVTGVSTVAETQAVRLRITVLPSRGDIPFRVASGGGRAGLFASFEMAGRTIHQARGGGPGRGIHFVVLNGDTGILGPTRSFDTWLSQTAADEMADYLNALPIGTLVLGAIADEGTLNLTPRARSALRQVLRSQYVDILRYQDSWAIMTRIGAPMPIAESVAGDQPAVIERVLTF